MAKHTVDFNFPEDFYLDDVGVWRLKKEKLAEMEAPRPQTNEEWLRSCSDAMLAVAIYNAVVAAAVRIGCKISLENRTGTELKDAIYRWLQEVHQ